MKTSETPMSQIGSIFAYFHDPAHSVESQMASSKTQYVWQHMSNYFLDRADLVGPPQSEKV